MLFVAETNQRESHQWAAVQVEGAPRIFCGHLESFRFALVLGQSPEVHDWQFHRGRWTDDLDGLPLHGVKCRSPDFMPPDNLGERPLQRSDIEGTFPVNSDGLIKEWQDTGH
jgi:hypothetical protein